jgi:hypothetical protein
MEVVGVDADGGLHVSRIWPSSTVPPETISAWPAEGDRYRAVARRHGTHLLAGVAHRGIHWLRGKPSNQPVSATPLTLENPVAAFAMPASGELLIVEGDVSLVRVPIPE